jgi:hypothetical protein
LALAKQLFAVKYQEFKGSHEIPPDIRRESVDWFFGTPK